MPLHRMVVKCMKGADGETSSLPASYPQDAVFCRPHLRFYRTETWCEDALHHLTRQPHSVGLSFQGNEVKVLRLSREIPCPVLQNEPLLLSR
jgi:hypothetical protein